MKRLISVIIGLIALINLSYTQGGNIMTPKEECEILMNELFPFAQQMLEKYQEFYPFGSVMNNDQSIRAITFYDRDENPKSSVVIARLVEIYNTMSKNNEIKASAIIWDAKILLPNTKSESDAVIISLEHKEGYSVQVVFPYKIVNNDLSWDVTFAMKGKNEVFHK